MSVQNRTFITSEQMAAVSRKATSDGLRQVANALKTQKLPDSSASEADDDSDSDEDYEDDSKTRYIKLNLATLHVQLEEEKAKVEALTLCVSPFKNINTELGFIKGAVGRSYMCENLNKRQLEMKLKLFIDETAEHVILCNREINKIEYHEIQSSLSRILASERKKITQAEARLKRVIFQAHIKEILIKVSVIISTVVVFLIILRILF